MQKFIKMYVTHEIFLCAKCLANFESTHLSFGCVLDAHHNCFPIKIQAFNTKNKQVTQLAQHNRMSLDTGHAML